MRGARGRKLQILHAKKLLGFAADPQLSWRRFGNPLVTSLTTVRFIL
jgi:hypothetical protein